MSGGRSLIPARLCYEWDNIKPDMVILGKALSGGSEWISYF